MSLDMSTFMSTMLSFGSDIFNALIPIFGIVLGITLGLGLLFLIFKLIAARFPSA